ncbi:ubiquilin-1 isoform X1 [Cynoglossus semilaevis]|uniref:ubiquilin-1 isoform X1 n=1 Tax=Cynoglossus semilaevis TaxID=244447 RepID=UPI0007DC875A|nr:ubiquilin-1 isoform X1 [Cynoglossus semilaevis]XP_024908773.1 ubiquilin-1 isoform X1 [Cynoglossus semilaevis]
MSSTDEDGVGGSQKAEMIHVSVTSLTGRNAFTVRYNCSVTELKEVLSGRLETPAEQLVVIHSGRVLGESEVLGDLTGQGDSVRLCMIQSPQCLSAVSSGDVNSETVQSGLPDVIDFVNLLPSPTSPLCLVEGLDDLCMPNSGPGFFPAIQHQMEQQLLGDPEMMRRLVGSPLVQSTLSMSSPQITKQLILSNPQIQQLLETNPEIGDTLNNTDIITQVQELLRNPDMIEEVMSHGDILHPQKDKSPETFTSDSYGRHETKTKKQDHLTLLQTGLPLKAETDQKSPSSGQSTLLDPLRELTAEPDSQSSITAGIQSLLEEIMASPGLMGSLLSGPYVSSLLKCLSQNPDLAAQTVSCLLLMTAEIVSSATSKHMLLSHPLFSDRPQLQQQMRQQLPVFLQQMQSPALLLAMMNPKAMEALLQIQQGLQTLAAEAPALLPVAEFGNNSTSTASDLTSNSVLTNQSGNGPHVATVTEQQQQFVHQMLMALTTADNGTHQQETEFQEEQITSAFNASERDEQM